MNGEAIHGDETVNRMLMGGWERELAVLKRPRWGCFCRRCGLCADTIDLSFVADRASIFVEESNSPMVPDCS